MPRWDFLGAEMVRNIRFHIRYSLSDPWPAAEALNLVPRVVSEPLFQS